MPRGYRKSLRTTTTTTTSLALSSSAPFRMYTSVRERQGTKECGCPPHLTRRRPLEARPHRSFRLLAHLFTVVGVGPPCGRAAGWFVFGGASRSVLLLLTLHRGRRRHKWEEGGGKGNMRANRSGRLRVRAQYSKRRGRGSKGGEESKGQAGSTYESSCVTAKCLCIFLLSRVREGGR